MARQPTITLAARNAGVEITRQRLAYAGEETTAEGEDGPPEIDLYVPRPRRPPIVIALQPDLEVMLERGTLSDFAADAELIGVIVDPADQIDFDFLSRIADASDTDVVVALSGETL